jgi:hypothetical protein
LLIRETIVSASTDDEERFSRLSIVELQKRIESIEIYLQEKANSKKRRYNNVAMNLRQLEILKSYLHLKQNPNS